MTPSQLLSEHKILGPAIYCVGVSERNLKDPYPAFEATIVGPDNSAKNRSSIAAMVMWPGTPPRVSHYFAGDLDDDREIAIMDWLDTENPRIEKITSVKLNHHGSATSTPLKLFRRFQPLNTFIPTPVNARHSHPSTPYSVYPFSTFPFPRRPFRYVLSFTP